MDDVNLGFMPVEHASRDAVHIAVIPAIAGEALVPGTWVAKNKDVFVVAKDAKDAVGIVDPFRRLAVKKGSRFWLCLFPKTVTSLRHHWTHPAFPADEKTADNADDIAKSEMWLREYAARMNCYDEPDAAYERLIDGLKSGELFAYGSDLHGLHELDDADNLRYHAEKVIGIRIDFNDFSFSCSC